MSQLRTPCIGILREVKNKWERRTPLIPADVRRLVSSGIRVLVQPSSLRIFTDAEFAAAGAAVTEDLTEARTILGVKDFPPSSLLPNASYLIFSHTIKAQPAGLPLLDGCLAKRCRLFDYETIRNAEGKRMVAFGQYAGMAGMIDGLRGLGERLLSRGLSSPFMGVSSAYMYPDIASARQAVLRCGEEISRVGLPHRIAPFTAVFTGAGNVAQGARSIFDLLPHREVKPSQLPSLPRDAHALFSCSIDASHLVQRLPASPSAAAAPFDKQDYYANPADYAPVFHSTIAPYTSLLVNGMYWDDRYPRLLTAAQYRSLQRSHPNALIAIADITCDVNGSIEFLRRTSSIERPFLLYDGIKDELRDAVDGDGVLLLAVDNLPAEFPRDASTYFSSKLAPLIPALARNDASLPLAENALPPELLNACIVSDGALTPNYQYISNLRRATESAAVLPSSAEQERRISASHPQPHPQHPAAATVTAKMLLSGHLLDSGFINHAFDVVERFAADFRVLFFDVSPNRQHRQNNHSHAVLEATFDSHARLEEAVNAIQTLAKVMNKAEVVFRYQLQQPDILHSYSSRDAQDNAAAALPSPAVAPAAPATPAPSLGSSLPAAARQVSLAGTVPGLSSPSPPSPPSPSRFFSAASTAASSVSPAESGSSSAVPGASSPASTYVAAAALPHILVLGSGFVAAPLVDWLAKRGYPMTVASNALADAQKLTAAFPNCRPVALDASDTEAVSALVASSALTISLLPHSFHPAIAKLCLQHSRHLLTASYVSPAMRALHRQAEAKGLHFMNELGLDPGIDHMSAMQAIDRLREDGRRVVSFSSVCGGLPAPDCADNPFAYKFSWSPAGMLAACVREARWREAGRLREVKGEQLLAEAREYELDSPMRLEVYPNHDSLLYEQLYGLTAARDMFRGTLRYRGTSEIMRGCSELGLLSREKRELADAGWRALMAALVSDDDVERGMRRRMQDAGMTAAGVRRTTEALRWLGALSPSTPLSAAAASRAASTSAFDEFCSLLTARLSYAPGQRDLVVLEHRFVTETEAASASSSSSRQMLTSTLLAYGDVGGYSAMGRTVALPAAMGAKLILDGGISERGVIIPVRPEVYRPILHGLQQEGIRFTDKVTELQADTVSSGGEGGKSQPAQRQAAARM